MGWAIKIISSHSLEFYGTRDFKVNCGNNKAVTLSQLNHLSVFGEQ